jgi:hypothetical protein
MAVAVRLVWKVSPSFLTLAKVISRFFAFGANIVRGRSSSAEN